jgi:MFS family permease
MVFTNPLFTCRGSQATESYACLNLDTCTFGNPSTGTYSADLYCQHRDARMVIQSIFAIGCILGMLTIPLLGDLKGKKFGTAASIASMLTGNLLLLAGIAVKCYEAIGMGMFLSAYGSSSMAATSYSLISDFFSHELKKRAILYFYAAW